MRVIKETWTVRFSSRGAALRTQCYTSREDLEAALESTDWNKVEITRCVIFEDREIRTREEE